MVTPRIAKGLDGFFASRLALLHPHRRGGEAFNQGSSLMCQCAASGDEPGWEGTYTHFDGSKHYAWVPMVRTHDGATRADYSRAIMPPMWSISDLQEARSRLMRAAAPSANTTMLARDESSRSPQSA